MDFADALEELRGTLRSLCTGPVQLDVESAYGDDIANPDRLAVLVQNLRLKSAKMSNEARAHAEESSIILKALSDRMREGLNKPEPADLCLRYGRGDLDARTVMYITGWQIDQMYDEYARIVGKPAPAAY